MGTFSIKSWLEAINALLALGASLADIVALIKRTLGPDDSGSVLAVLLGAWRVAKDENEARIAELETQIAAGNG